ncbi:hypothetical protein RFI_06727 [Reticulomyxa filosa]|uniref:Uncharacterized protein n=1 Tax=Reticulomyxa filosa TaxID=46433 RepID=X6NX54_RETFI|nr:hypothetical protein RFI_06727 [Reticulomyxa filosa]|eukprot:ETO30389.1 hypothetical protein RFI_06727 [Reticulomyxa filosa]
MTLRQDKNEVSNDESTVSLNEKVDINSINEHHTGSSSGSCSNNSPTDQENAEAMADTPSLRKEVSQTATLVIEMNEHENKDYQVDSNKENLSDSANVSNWASIDNPNVVENARVDAPLANVAILPNNESSDRKKRCYANQLKPMEMDIDIDRADKVVPPLSPLSLSNELNMSQLSPKQYLWTMLQDDATHLSPSNKTALSAMKNCTSNCLSLSEDMNNHDNCVCTRQLAPTVNIFPGQIIGASHVPKPKQKTKQSSVKKENEILHNEAMLKNDINKMILGSVYLFFFSFHFLLFPTLFFSKEFSIYDKFCLGLYLIAIETNSPDESGHLQKFVEVTVETQYYIDALELFGTHNIVCDECVHLFYAAFFVERLYKKVGRKKKKIAQKYYWNSALEKAYQYCSKALHYLRTVHQILHSKHAFPKTHSLSNRFDAGVMWDKCVDLYILTGCVFRANSQYKEAKQMFLSALALSEIYEKDKPADNILVLFLQKKKKERINKTLIQKNFVYVRYVQASVEHLAYLTASDHNTPECIKWCEKLIQLIEEAIKTSNDKEKQIKLLNAKSFYGCVLLQSQDRELKIKGETICTEVVGTVYGKDPDLMWRFCTYFGTHYAMQQKLRFLMTKTKITTRKYQLYKVKGGRVGHQRRQLLFDYLDIYSEKLTEWIANPKKALTPEQKWNVIKPLKLMELCIEHIKLYKDKEIKKNLSIALTRYRYAFIFYECGQYAKAAEVAQAFIDPQTPLHEQCTPAIGLFKYIQSLIKSITNVFVAQNKQNELPQPFEPFVEKHMKDAKLPNQFIVQSLPCLSKQNKFNRTAYVNQKTH